MKSFPACAGGIRSPGMPPNKFGRASRRKNSPTPCNCAQKQTAAANGSLGWTNGGSARVACGFGRRARTIGGTIQFGKRFSARRRKRQPGRSRSPAKMENCSTFSGQTTIRSEYDIHKKAACKSEASSWRHTNATAVTKAIA
jgi:hypothetical protein